MPSDEFEGAALATPRNVSMVGSTFTHLQPSELPLQQLSTLGAKSQLSNHTRSYYLTMRIGRRH